MTSVVKETPNATLWYKEGTNLLHREEGPAIVYRDGSEEWYLDGERHCLIGPAMISDGHKEWWVNGDKLTEREFLLKHKPGVIALRKRKR